MGRALFAIVFGTSCLSITSCQEPLENLSTFAVAAAPARFVTVEWTELTTDARGNGVEAESADGRALAYYYDAATDTLWFRLSIFGEIDPARPAVSISIDVDADQATGIPWYGTNSGFMFDKMLSVGPLEAAGALVRGYNGITNADGVTRRDWINERQGVLTFYVDAPGRAYIVGVARADISPNLATFHVIGSVGANALWNDDIGESGYATIDLEPPPAS